MAYISATSKDTYEITCKIAGLDSNYSYSDRYVKWYYNNSYKGTSYIGSKVSSGGSLTATGLSPNTTYSIEADIYYSGGLLVSLSGTATTRSLPQLTSPTLNTGATIKTNTSIQITMYTVSEAERYYARINGGTIYSGTGRTFNFTGLSPNKQYLIKIKCSANGYLDSDWAGYYATTSAIANFNWTTSERNAFNNQGLTTAITYERWNAFVDRIYDASSNDWRVSSSDGATLSYSNTRMNSSDKLLTADRFNSARYNIGSRIPTGINRVYKDDIVYGSYFITLETKLNQLINNL